MHLGSVTAWHSSSGREPNFVALNRGQHLYLAGRPSRWALAHILVGCLLWPCTIISYITNHSNLSAVENYSAFDCGSKFNVINWNQFWRVIRAYIVMCVWLCLSTMHCFSLFMPERDSLYDVWVSKWYKVAGSIYKLSLKHLQIVTDGVFYCTCWKSATTKNLLNFCYGKVTWFICQLQYYIIWHYFRPPVDNIWAIMIVWRIRGKIIRTVLLICTHIWAVPKVDCWCRFRFSLD